MNIRAKLALVRANHKAMLLAASTLSALGGAAAGAAVGFKKASITLQAHYDARLEQELKDTKKFYERVHKTGGFADPEVLAAEIIDEDEENLDVAVEAVQEADKQLGDALEALKSYKGTPLVPEEKTEELHNIFNQAKRVELEDVEYKEDPTVPYIISKESYLNCDREFEQMSYTFYEVDDVLVDENDQPVDNPDKTVGEDNLMRFGYKSDDRNVVYIRNERLEMDFEILKSRGSYAKEVFGFAHSDRGPGVRKFRDLD